MISYTRRPYAPRVLQVDIRLTLAQFDQLDEYLVQCVTAFESSLNLAPFCEVCHGERVIVGPGVGSARIVRCTACAGTGTVTPITDGAVS